MPHATAQTANARREESASDIARRLNETREYTISLLAKECRADVSQVRALYDLEHGRLESQAKIKTYIPVIAARLVRVALEKMPSSTQLQ